MRARIDIAVDRDPQLLIEQFVTPLDSWMRESGAGGVVSHAVDGHLWVTVDLRLKNFGKIDEVLELLTKNDAPVGTTVYRFDWLRRKRDVVVLGPRGM